MLEGIEMADEVEGTLLFLCPFKNDTKTDPFATLKTDPTIRLLFTGRIFQETSTEKSPKERSRRIWLGWKTSKVEEPPICLMLDKCCWQKYLDGMEKWGWCFRWVDS